MLVVAAALLHASWNGLAKTSGDKLAFLWLAMGMASVVLLPVAVALCIRGGVPASSVPLLAASAALHAVYLATLSRAYQHGEFSRVYPIARGLSVALVGVVAWLALGEGLSPWGIVAVIAVIAGVAVVAEPWRRNAAAGVGWALVTGCIIAAYSVVDKAGVQRAQPLPYFVLMIATACALLAPACALLAPVMWRRRRHRAAEWRRNRRSLAIAAVGTLGAYLLVLQAMRLSAAAYVAACRELSIVASVVIARVVMAEQTRMVRLAGAALITVGVVGLARV